MTQAALLRGRYRARLGGFLLDAAFEIPARGVTGLFGPSGSGKSTLLRCIAGLHRPDEGFLDVAGDVWQDERRFRKTHQRPIGYVFQEASLFPHLNVRDNLLYGAPRRSPSAAVAADEVIDLLGLNALIGRDVRTLSGGERQRVAIGRALLSQPRLLLMDEPLSALDRESRDDILPFLERLHERLQVPVLYVTHELGEIERLADHLVLMRAGRVIASGALAEVQADPALPLARARDAAVSHEATVEDYDDAYGLATLRIEGARLIAPAPRPAPGARYRIRIAAGDVSLTTASPQATSILNVLPARIVAHAPLGASEIVVVLALGPDGDGARLLARVTRRSWEHLALAPGRDVFAQVKGVALARPRPPS